MVLSGDVAEAWGGWWLLASMAVGGTEAPLGRVKSPSESEPLDVEDAISRYLT